MDTKAAEAAKDRVKVELMAIPGVNGVGVTEANGKPAILILIASATPELTAALPHQIEGYPVVVMEVGEIRGQPARPD